MIGQVLSSQLSKHRIQDLDCSKIKVQLLASSMKFKRPSGPTEQIAKVYFMPYCSGSEDITPLSRTLLLGCHPEQRRNQPQYLRSRLPVMGYRYY